MSEQNQEHRIFSRIIFDAQATIVGQEQEWDTELLDISLKGALVKKPESWDAPVNSRFSLRISLSEDATIEMETTVVHVENGHIGFHCDHINLESITHLRRIVELNTGNEDLLNRELSALRDS
ncbi:MAG TPA: PilZ domain-containing protein [Gammaproteobacteria bacterium]|nr:PilZ domain-containing protein [Gammaproteobacteria bacterium]